jgi:hypothetical protein
MPAHDFSMRSKGGRGMTARVALVLCMLHTQCNEHQLMPLKSPLTCRAWSIRRTTWGQTAAGDTKACLCEAQACGQGKGLHHQGSGCQNSNGIVSSTGLRNGACDATAGSVEAPCAQLDMALQAYYVTSMPCRPALSMWVSAAQLLLWCHRL